MTGRLLQGLQGAGCQSSRCAGRAEPVQQVNWWFDDWGGGPGNPQNWTGGDNAETGKRTGTSMAMRTYKLSVRYLF
jgi:hypothetical protein